MYNSLEGSVSLTDICLSLEAFFPFGGKSPGSQAGKNDCPGLGQWATAGQVTWGTGGAQGVQV